METDYALLVLQDTFMDVQLLKIFQMMVKPYTGQKIKVIGKEDHHVFDN